MEDHVVQFVVSMYYPYAEPTLVWYVGLVPRDELIESGDIPNCFVGFDVDYGCLGARDTRYRLDLTGKISCEGAEGFKTDLQRVQRTEVGQSTNGGKPAASSIQLSIQYKVDRGLIRTIPDAFPGRPQASSGR